MRENGIPGHTPSARSNEEERVYLLGRAEAHRQLAEHARVAETKVVHIRLHELYSERASLIDMVLPD